MSDKVMLVAATLEGGGSERVMTTLANELLEQGFEVTLVVTAPTTVAYPIDSRIEVITLNTKYKNKLVKMWKKLTQLRQIYKKAPGVPLISFMPDVCIYNAVATLGLPNKVIMSERSAPMCNPDQPYKRVLRTLSYFFADICVFQTEGARDYFPKAIRKKGVIIENPLLGTFPSIDREHREKTIIMVGRAELSKNIPLFIDAMELLHQKHPEYVAKIFGKGGYKEDMIKLTAQKGLQDTILFEDFSRNIYEEYGKAFLFVSSANYEGMSNAMLEALAMGTPAVVTDCPSGGARAIVRTGENGILVPMNDAHAMCEAICRIIEEEGLWMRMSEKATGIRERLELKKIVKQWIELM